MKNYNIIKNKVKIVLLLLLILVIGGGLISCETNSIKASNAIVYEIVSGNGGVVVREDVEEEIYVGLRIKAGDIISTDSESQIYIRIDDTKNILLEQDSSLEVTEHSNGKLVLTLIEGECFFDVTEKLAEGEEMVFAVSNSTMSIRGTSGTLKNDGEEGKFTILTGIGYVKSKETESGNEKEINLYPNTKVSFELESDSFEVAHVTIEDLPEVFIEYVKETEEYQTELVEDGWDIDTSSDEIVVPEETEEEITENTLLGFREDENGNWIFNQEDFDNGYGPTYYGAIYNDVYPDKPTLKCQQSTYNGKSQTAKVSGYDQKYMTIENNVHTSSGTYKISVYPKGKWSDGTTDPVTINWVIKKDNIEINEEVLEFEFTGKPFNIKLTSKYKDTTFLRYRDGVWTEDWSDLWNCDSYTVKVRAVHDSCESYDKDITININKANITPKITPINFHTGEELTYDKENKRYILDGVSSVDISLKYENGDGVELTSVVGLEKSIIRDSMPLETISGTVETSYSYKIEKTVLFGTALYNFESYEATIEVYKDKTDGKYYLTIE